MEPYSKQNASFQDNSRKKIKLLVILVIVLGVLFSALGVYDVIQTRKFHVVSTNPSVGSVTDISPFFKIAFNEPLSPNNVSLTSTSSVAASYKIQGQVLNITPTTPLQAGKSYTITIHDIYDTKGDVIKDKLFTFKAKAVDTSKLPVDQEKAILEKQINQPRSKESISYAGTDTLISQGITITQLNDLEEAFYNFSPNARSVSINDSTVATGPLNQNNPDFTMNFSVIVDSTTYNATISYAGLSDIDLVLYNPTTNTQVFDSGIINAPGGD